MQKMLEVKMRKRKSSKQPQKLNPVLRIYTEGEKTEINYVKSYIKDYLKQAGHIGHAVIVVQPDDYSPYGLLQAAINDKDRLANDQIWLVFDCDGHDNKAKTFAEAKNKNINIAYSSICFETWILLHFKYTTKPFNCCDEIKKALDEYFDKGYDKAGSTIFIQAAGEDLQRLQKARANAKKLCMASIKSDPNKNIWERNPYTNVHELLNAIDTFLKQSKQ